MRWFVLTLALLSTPSLAQDAGAMDAGTVDAGAVVMPAVQPVLGPVAVSADGGTVDSIPADITSAASMAKTVFTAVKTGDWWLAAAALLLLVVGLLRTVMRKFHDWLPDDNIMDKPLIFLYDTKVGGWILNWLTATGGGIGTAMAAGVKVDFSLWKSVLIVSTSGSALFELYKDIKEWWVAKQAAKKKAADEEAAKKAAVVNPPADPPKPA